MQIHIGDIADIIVHGITILFTRLITEDTTIITIILITTKEATTLLETTEKVVPIKPSEGIIPITLGEITAVLPITIEDLKEIHLGEEMITLKVIILGEITHKRLPLQQTPSQMMAQEEVLEDNPLGAEEVTLMEVLEQDKYHQT